jgi:twinkle protein
MQFMISRERAGSSTFDKFDVQDMAIERFRQFATDKNVHVTLVVHPRKEQEDSKLSMASIYGSAKATQEADTVLILQNDNKRKYIEVKKNRFNGALGHCPLFFDRTSGRYSEQPQINGGGGGGGGGHAATATSGPQASANKPAASWDMYRR